jgi:hypothetical protein
MQQVRTQALVTTTEYTMRHYKSLCEREAQREAVARRKKGRVGASISFVEKKLREYNRHLSPTTVWVAREIEKAISVETGHALIAQKTLAKRRCCTVRTIQNAVRQLRQYSIYYTLQTDKPGRINRKGVNRYYPGDYVQKTPVNNLPYNLKGAGYKCKKSRQPDEIPDEEISPLLDLSINNTKHNCIGTEQTSKQQSPDFPEQKTKAEVAVSYSEDPIQETKSHSKPTQVLRGSLEKSEHCLSGKEKNNEENRVIAARDKNSKGAQNQILPAQQRDTSQVENWENGYRLLADNREMDETEQSISRVPGGTVGISRRTRVKETCQTPTHWQGKSRPRAENRWSLYAVLQRQNTAMGYETWGIPMPQFSGRHGAGSMFRPKLDSEISG